MTTRDARPRSIWRLTAVIPGVALCASIGVAAWALDAWQRQAAGRSWLEPVVLAILIGAVVRLLWTPSQWYAPGIDATAKPLLETAVVLLGASVDVPLLARAGPALAVGIVAAVTAAIFASYALGRALGLNRQLALLVACGNSICGNSAIAAVAPTIRATADDVASAIAFTAALGVAVVLLLPPFGHALGYSALQFGVLAGLSVYAVPQVLAVTLAFDPLSAQIGTLVKLVRVLMLGPVVLTLGSLEHRATARETSASGGPNDARRVPIGQLVPWFIVGFVALAALRAMRFFDDAQVVALRDAARVLTVLAMAALGLGVDARSLGRGGLAVTAAVALSLLLLIAISLALIAVLQLH